MASIGELLSVLMKSVIVGLHLPGQSGHVVEGAAPVVGPISKDRIEWATTFARHLSGTAHLAKAESQHAVVWIRVVDVAAKRGILVTLSTVQTLITMAIVAPVSLSVMWRADAAGTVAMMQMAANAAWMGEITARLLGQVSGSRRSGYAEALQLHPRIVGPAHPYFSGESIR
jgi:hypothetical protein